MATGKDLGALIGQLGADTRQWDKAMSGARNDLGRLQAAGVAASQKIGRAFDRMGQGLQAAGRTLTMGLTVPLAGAGAMAVKKAGDFQKLQVQMDALTGSAEAGAKAFERLVQFSARTPFQLEELTRVNNTLMGFGANSEDAFQWMTMLADAAAISGANMQGLAIAFGQSSAEGKLLTRDIRQLINQGLPATKLLAESMGVAQSQIFELAEQGEISFDVLVRALERATAEGGIYEDGVEKLAKTIPGLFSTLKDRASVALSELGEAISETLDLETLIPQVSMGIQTLVEMFTNMSEDSRVQFLKIAGLMALSGPVALAMGKFVSLIGGFVKFIGKAIPLVAATFRKSFFLITAVFTIAASAAQQVINLWRILTDDTLTLAEKAEQMADSFLSPMETAKEAIGKTVGAVLDATEAAFEGIQDKIADVTGLDDALVTFYDTWDRLAKESADNVEQSAKRASDAMKKAFGGGVSPAGGVSTPKVQAGAQFGMDTAIADVTKGTLRKAETQFSSIAEAMAGVTEQAMIMGDAFQSTVTSAVANFAETLGNAFTGDAGAKGFFKNLLLVVIDFANQFGKLLVAAGVAAKAFQKLLINPAAAIVAGGALIALTTAIRNLLAEGPSKKVNDALITSDGRVIEFHPDDDILAMKDFSKMGAVGAGASNPAQNRAIEEAIIKGMERATVRISSNYVDEKLKEFQRFQERIGN